MTKLMGLKSVDSLGTDGDKSPRAGHRNCPINLRLSKHWKALEEHILIYSIQPFSGDAFSEFSQKIQSLTL
jgi:hypothetical protein